MQTLGGYTLISRLGAGGMGEVWKGRRTALGGSAVDVAIKVLSATKIDDLDARAMFLDEARLSMLLTNSNIVKVFDADETEAGICYMVMEWVDGLNLAELTDRMRKAGERLPDTIIAYIVGEVLKGLAHAHELRHEGKPLTIVHRDVSPHNVMLSVFGEVKIMDFGIARVASEDTSGMHVKGKIRYMPPEQLRGDSREPTLDLFAAGAILHELLDGTKFRAQVIDEGRLYGMVLDGQIPALRRAADELPKELDELRQGLLAANSKERIQTAREAFRRLSSWSGYRDARFELDEIVRRFVGAREEEAVAPVHTLPTMPASPARFRVESGPAEVTVTEGLKSDGADTDVGTRPGAALGVAVSVQPRSAGPRGVRALDVVLALAGVGFLGFAIVALVWAVKMEKRQGGAAKAEDEVEQTQEVEPVGEDDEVEPEGPRVDFGTPPTPTQPATTPEPKVEGETGAGETDEGETEAGEVADDTETKPQPTPELTKRVKVSFALGGGVPWAEIKLGSRSFVLDAFSAKSKSSSFAPGTYNASYRTKVDGPWKKAGRVEVPRRSVSFTLQKSGELVVK